MPGFDRVDRISDEVRRAMDNIIRMELRDPRAQCTFSIVRCEVTRDLRYCTMHISVLETEKREPMMAALKSASGFLRRELGRAVNLRYTPELIFKLDVNIEYAAKINRILKENAHDADNE